MKKKTAVILTSTLCAISLAAGAIASDIIREIKAELRPDFTVNIDGEVKNFKNAQGETVYPILYDGTTYLPVRAIGELMGKVVYWFEDEKKIELKENKSAVTDADVIISGGKSSSEEKAAEKPADSKVDTSTFIGADKAKEIALKNVDLEASNVFFDRIELDKDGGVWHYEVEFKKGYTEFDADIKADDGTILKWEVDLDD